MIVDYKLPCRTWYNSPVKYNQQLKTSRSPMLFLQDILYREKNLLKAAVPYLLRGTQEHHGPLYGLLHNYCNVFPWQLLKKSTPNRKLGDLHSILLESSTKPVYKRLCHYSP